MQKLISRAEFARRCGVSKQAISKACDGKLKPACVADRIDVDHEAARAYMAAKGITLGEVVSSAGAPTPKAKAGRSRSSAAPTSRKRQPAGAAAPTGARRAQPVSDGAARDGEGSDADLEDLAAALHPLIERFGTDERFKFWLESLKDIESIREKRLKNAATEGKLISRELVSVRVFGAFESLFKRLLADSSKTITNKLVKHVRAGGSVEEAERIFRDGIGSQLKPLKAAVVRNLRRQAQSAAPQSDS